MGNPTSNEIVTRRNALPLSVVTSNEIKSRSHCGDCSHSILDVGFWHIGANMNFCLPPHLLGCYDGCLLVVLVHLMTKIQELLICPSFPLWVLWMHSAFDITISIVNNCAGCILQLLSSGLFTMMAARSNSKSCCQFSKTWLEHYPLTSSGLD